MACSKNGKKSRCWHLSQTIWLCMELRVIFYIIHLPLELFPVLGLLTMWCASTHGTALLCSSRVDSDLGPISRWDNWGFIGHRATESHSHRHPRVLILRVGEIFLCLISINSPTCFARRRVRRGALRFLNKSLPNTTKVYLSLSL